MRGFGPSTFGDRIAEHYDQHYALETTPSQEKIDLLLSLAQGGRVLDVGCGTGMMAGALAAKGLSVTAIDSSPEMIRRVRAREDSDAIESAVCDITEDPVEGGFDLAYALFEVLIMVGDRRAQARALENLARSVRPGGKLLLEVSIMDLDRYAEYIGTGARVSSMAADRVVVGFSQYDRDTGRLDHQEVVLTEDGIRLFPIVMHPISPKDMVRLAAGAGFTVESQSSDWAGSKYRNGDPSLVIVFVRD